MNVQRLCAAALVGAMISGCSSDDGEPGAEPSDAGSDTAAVVDSSVLPDTATRLDTSTSPDTATTPDTTSDTATTPDTAATDTAPATDTAATDTSVAPDTTPDVATDVADVADGSTSTAPAPLLALSPFAFENIAALATDGAGNVVVSSSSTVAWTAPAATTALPFVGAKDLWVAKYNDAGAHVWSKQFGSTVDDGIGDLAIVPGSGAQAGNVVAVGTLGGAVDLGGGNVSGAVIFERSSASGAHVWSTQFSTTSPPALLPASVAVDALGNVYVTLLGKGTTDLGAPIGSITTSGNDVVIVKYGSTGAPVWAKKYGDAGDQLATSLAIDAAHNQVITGSNKGGTLDFGGGKSTTAGVFIAKLDADGAPLWLRGAGTSTDSGGADVAIDASGDVLAIGAFPGGTIDFGGEVLTGSGMYLVKLKGSDGTRIWSKLTPAAAPRLAVDAAGNVLITGRIGAAVDFGGGTFAAPASGDSNMFIVKYAASNGAHVWSRAIGTTKVDWGYGIGGGLSNAVWAFGRGGTFGVTDIDLGGGVKAQGPAFLVKYPAL
jgi:hypothetical protein